MSEFEVTVKLQRRIPVYLIGEVRSKLAYLDEEVLSGTVSENGEILVLKCKGQPAKKKAAEIIQKATRLAESMVKDSYQPKVKVLEDHLDRPASFQQDPMPVLIEMHEVFKENEGVYTLGPLLSRLINYFEGQFLSLAADFGAQPYRFPTLMPAAFLERVNYFKAFPHSLSFATHLRSDLEVIADFSNDAHCKDGHLSTGMDSFAKIQNLLSPAVCYHLYFSLADRRLKSDTVIATAVGNCFRYESSNLDSLERLWNFSMREIIFIGSKSFVLERREAARSQVEKLFEKIGFVYKVENANDPFFIGEFKQAAFQNAFQLKYEIRAALPYKGSTLAVGSYNYHQDFFGKHLNITLPGGGPIHTGCVAFGLERMALAFVAQFGVDPIHWPQSIREGLV